MCKKFYSTLCIEIINRYDFSNSALSHIDIFTPKSALSIESRSQYQSLFLLLERFSRFYDAKDRQAIDNEWRLLCNYCFKETDLNVQDEIDVF